MPFSVYPVTARQQLSSVHAVSLISFVEGHCVSQMYRREGHNGLMPPQQPHQPPPPQQQQQPQLDAPVAREPLLLFPLLQQHRSRQGISYSKDMSSGAPGIAMAPAAGGSQGGPTSAGAQWRWALGRNDRKKVCVTALCLQGEVPLELQQVNKWASAAAFAVVGGSAAFPCADPGLPCLAVLGD